MAAVRTLNLNFRKYRSWRPLKYPFDSELDLNLHNPLNLQKYVGHTHSKQGRQATGPNACWCCVSGTAYFVNRYGPSNLIIKRIRKHVSLIKICTKTVKITYMQYNASHVLYYHSIIRKLVENRQKFKIGWKLPIHGFENWLQPDENLVNTALGQSDEIVIGKAGTLPAVGTEYLNRFRDNNDY